MPKKLDDIERVVSMFQSGMTQIQIAKAISRSQHYVSRRLICVGVARSRKETCAIKQKSKIFEPRNDIVDLYSKGLSSVEIARLIRKSHGYVLRHVRAAGIVRTAGKTLHLRSLRTDPVIRIQNGYAVFSRGGKDFPLHRAIAEAAIGRKLGRWELVHHKDRNPLNNSLSNLEVMSPAEHIREHRWQGKKCVHCQLPQMARCLCKNHYQMARRNKTLYLYPTIVNYPN